MRDEELAKFLIEGRAIAPETLADAQKYAVRSGKSLEQYLIDERLVNERDLLIAKGRALRAPYMDLDDMVPDSELVRTLPEHLLYRYTVLPVRVEGDYLVLAMADPSNVMAIDDIRLITGFSIRPAIAAADAITRCLKRCFDDDGPLFLPGKSEKPGLLRQMSREKLLALVDEPVIVRFVNLVISQALNDGASEIILQPGEAGLAIYYVVNTVRSEVMTPPLHVRDAVTARLKLIVGLDPTACEAPAQGAVHITHDGRQFTLRVTTEPGEWGEKITIEVE